MEHDNPGPGDDDDDLILIHLDRLMKLVVWAICVLCHSSSVHVGANGSEQFWNSVNHDEGVRCQLELLRAVPNVFKLVTNFTVEEFDELASIVCPRIKSRACSTGGKHVRPGRPPKLSPEQRLYWMPLCS
jgi:hypothetical protein